MKMTYKPDSPKEKTIFTNSGNGMLAAEKRKTPQCLSTTIHKHHSPPPKCARKNQQTTSRKPQLLDLRCFKRSRLKSFLTSINNVLPLTTHPKCPSTTIPTLI